MMYHLDKVYQGGIGYYTCYLCGIRRERGYIGDENPHKADCPVKERGIESCTYNFGFLNLIAFLKFGRDFIGGVPESYLTGIIRIISDDDIMKLCKIQGISQKLFKIRPDINTSCSSSPRKS